MNKQRLWLAMLMLVILALTLSFLGFDFYASDAANELMNAVLRSEATAIQQGNLISSITKLQSSVETSESLRAVAVYDTSLDPKLKFPLIVLGHLPNFEPDALAAKVVRLGVFDKIYIRDAGANKALLFYFNPKFVLWSYSIFSLLLIFFSFLIAFLTRQLGQIREHERAQVFNAISQQISHDIKSPLSALKLTAGVLQRKGFAAEILFGAIKRIEEIVHDLKVGSEAPVKIFNAAKPFRIDECIKQIIAEKILEYPNHTFLLESEYACEALGVPGQFSRVISNLLNNSVEASPIGVPVVVNMSRVGCNCKIGIKDRGKGIPIEDQSRVFERGYSVGKPTGSGLGLFHAREVMLAMGGKISLSSSREAGTVVIVEAPLMDL